MERPRSCTCMASQCKGPYEVSDCGRDCGCSGYDVFCSKESVGADHEASCKEIRREIAAAKNRAVTRTEATGKKASVGKATARSPVFLKTAKKTVAVKVSVGTDSRGAVPSVVLEVTSSAISV